MSISPLIPRVAALLVPFLIIMYAGGPSAVLKTVKIGTYSVLGLSSVLAFALYWFQTRLIYPANIPEGSRLTVMNPFQAFGIPYRDLTLTTPDKIHIRAYLIPALSPYKARSLTEAHNTRKLAKSSSESTGENTTNTPDENGWVGPKRTDDDARYSASRPTIIMFQANAGNMGHRVPIAHVFWQMMGCNVFMLSYRGYGLSDGRPTESGLRVDAQTALDYVSNDPILKDTKMIVYGQSLGGAVCIDVASRNPSKISALILENTVFSLRTLVPRLIPFLKPLLAVPGILTEKWDASLSLPLIPKTTPILLLAALKDEVVHPSEMREIKNLRKKNGAKVQWVEFPEATHNDTVSQAKYFQTVDEFIKKEVIKGEK